MQSSSLESSSRPGIFLQSPDNLINPFPTYASMRDQYPVCQIEPNGIWAVSRFKDVRFVLAHHELFSAAAISSLYESDWVRDECKTERLIITQDPPEHCKYKGLVNRAFVDSATKYLIPLMRDTAKSLLSGFNQKSPIDFVEHFAYPYIGKITRDIMGIGEKQSLSELKRWVTLEGAVTPTRPSDDFIDAFEKAILKQNGYFLEVIEDRRKQPKSDLVTHLVNEEIDKEKLSNKQICGLMCLLVQAGFFTTVHMLGHALIQLSRRPEILAKLVALPQLIPNFIEELLRFSPSVHGVIRMTTQDVELSGVTIPKGALVMPLLASANHDSSQFLDPDNFDLSRPRINQHLAFGNSGAHTCVGASLARLEIKIVLEALLEMYSHISCPNEDELVWENSLFVRGVTELPVSLR